MLKLSPVVALRAHTELLISSQSAAPLVDGDKDFPRKKEKGKLDLSSSQSLECRECSASPKAVESEPRADVLCVPKGGAELTECKFNFSPRIFGLTYQKKTKTQNTFGS